MRLFATGLIVTCSFLTCAAQEAGYGIVIGAQNSNIKVAGNNGNSLKGESIARPLIGIISNNNLSDKFRLVTSYTISFTGADFTDEMHDQNAVTAPENGPATDKFRLMNLNLSLLPGYAVHDMFHVLAGPELVFNFGGNFGEFDTYQTRAMYLMDESKKRLTFNFVLGSAFCYKNFRIDGRYNIGLSNYYTNEAISASPEFADYSNAKISSFSLSGSYIFSE